MPAACFPHSFQSAHSDRHQRVPLRESQANRALLRSTGPLDHMIDTHVTRTKRVCARGLPHSKSSVGSNSARPTPGVNPTEKLARPGAQKSASIDGTELAQSRAPAAATLMTLLEQARSEHVRKDVAVTLLGYSGIHAGIASGPVVNIGIGAGVGYIIDLSGPPGDQNGSRSHLSAVGGVIYDHEPAALVDVTPEDEQ